MPSICLQYAFVASMPHSSGTMGPLNFPKVRVLILATANFSACELPELFRFVQICSTCRDCSDWLQCCDALRTIWRRCFPKTWRWAPSSAAWQSPFGWPTLPRRGNCCNPSPPFATLRHVMQCCYQPGPVWPVQSCRQWNKWKSATKNIKI